jgi:hypothetical protein
VEPLRRVLEALAANGIPHMVAGSFASTHHGVPRATHDVDLVIDPTREALERFVESLSPESFYVSPEAAREAFRRRGQFNVVDLATGWKIDLILRKDRPFSREEFARRVPAVVLGVKLFVASAEDTILAKLEWGRAAESERQLRDVVGVIEMQRERLDWAYLERWARELSVSALLERARAVAGC